MKFIDYARLFVPDYELQENQKGTIEILWEYFSKQNFEYKGIMLFGDVGCGKTTLMQIFRRIAQDYNNNFEIYSERSIVRSYAENGVKGLEPFLQNRISNEYNVVNAYPKRICIDDYSATDQEAKYYGQNLNVVKEVLLDRYDLGIKTHLTTNIDINKALQIAGERLADRFKEMFHFVLLPGGSLRK